MNKVLFIDIDDVLFDTDHFKNNDLQIFKLYDDVKEALIKLKQIIKIAILSKGEDDFQKQKLIKTGLLDLFIEKDIHIVGEKDDRLKLIFEKYKGLEKYILDDRIDNLEKIKEIEPAIKTILIKRGRYQDLVSIYKPDYVVRNFEEIINLI